MCNICGYSICQCTPSYSYNWYNTDGQPCTTCTDTTICVKKVPAKCTLYSGTNLAAFGLTTNIDVETIIASANAAVNNLQISLALLQSPEYKKYIALLTQAGTNAPVATVLGTNTLGILIWGRTSAGVYTATLTGAFPAQAKFFAIFSPNLAVPSFGSVTWIDTNTIELQIGNSVLSDSLLNNTPIEIRVYN